MAAISSNGTGGGDWSAGASWAGGTAPGDGDHATILAGDTISIDGDITVGNDDATPAIDISGILERASSANDWTLTCKGDISVNNGGEFNIDMSDDASNWQKVVMNCATTDGKFGIIVDDGGKMDWDGASKLYATQLNDADAAASDTTITVDGDITGWQVDDELVIEGDVAGQTEKVVIASIASQVVTIDAPGLVSQHDDDRKVCNITRNVIFKSDNASYRTYIDNNSLTQANFDLNYVEIYRLYQVGTTQAGIDFATSCRGNITYCSIYSCWATALRLYTAGICNITHNIFYLSQTGIQTRSSVNRIVITDNYMFDITMFGIYLFDYVYGHIFNDNYICDSGTAIYIRSAEFAECKRNILRTNTKDIDIMSSRFSRLIFEDGSAESSTMINNYQNSLVGSYFRFNNLNSNNDDNRSYEVYGVVRSTGAGLADTEVRTAGSLALKMTPNDTDNALEWEFTVPCVTDQPMAVTGYLKSTEDCSGDTEPTIEISGCGMTADTYTCDTATNEDSYEQFVVAGTPTRDGLATVKVSAYKNAGNAPDFYLDDIVVTSTAIDLGALDYWYKGLPAPILLATGIGANDIWKVQDSIDFGSGAMGEKVKDTYDDTTAILADTDTMEADLKTYLDGIEDNIRGADDDDLKDISDEIAGITVDNDAIATAVHERVIEGSLTLEQMQRIMLSILAGLANGGGTLNLAFRDLADSKNRVDMTVDTNGNRSAVTLDGT